MRGVYLDWNATTPPRREVLAAMQAAAEQAWANPSSVHGAGRAAKAVVERAREEISALVGICARDIVFTSGGTEANNLGLFRPFAKRAGERLEGTLVTSRLEHPSVTAFAEALEAQGVTVSWLPVPETGRVDPDEIGRALLAASPGPRLVTLQAVNHETGVVQPVAEVAALTSELGAQLHVDAVQAVGKLSPEAWIGADTVALAAHKLRGPKGIGALCVRPGLVIKPLLRGGSQERGLRPGTVDPIAAAGFGAAARLAIEGPARYEALASLRDELEASLIALGEQLGCVPVRNGDGLRAPHVLNLSFPGWSGDELAAALDLEGVYVSAGSACAAGTSEPSPVITAMVGRERAGSAIRISLGEETSRADVSAAISAFERVLGRASR